MSNELSMSRGSLADTRQTHSVLGDDQEMSGSHRGYITEGKCLLVLINDISRDLASHYLVEEGYIFWDSCLSLGNLVVFHLNYYYEGKSKV